MAPLPRIPRPVYGRPAHLRPATRRFPILLTVAACTLLAGCEDFDWDMRRHIGAGLDTSAAARMAAAPRPEPDARGVISYPNYQVAVARDGDTVADVAARVGLPPAELARYNGIPLDARLRRDEVIALPSRVSEPPAGTPAANASGERIDITALAGGALDRAEASGNASTGAITPPSGTASATAATPAAAPAAASGAEPTRHKVARGETAYSVARRYNVTVKDLAEWNGLGTDLSLREGQYLLIPVAAAAPPAPARVESPGTGSATPVPPSAAEPLPAQTQPAAAPAAPASPALGAERESAASRLVAPVGGAIIRDYEKGKSSFVLFQASAGTPVKVAADGTVKLISKNADGVEIMVVDHGGGLQTAYSFIEGISVKKGDRVSKGQNVAKVAQNEFGAVQFMVFKGTQTVDPTPYLN